MKGFIRGFRSSSVMLLVMVAAALCISCRKDSPKKPVELDDFIRKQECGLVGYGGYLFKYSEEDCQLGINARRRQVRMQNDTQTDYVNVIFSRIPSSADVSVHVDVRYRVGADEITGSGMMDVVRFSGSRVWLWDSGKSMGIIVPLER